MFVKTLRRLCATYPIYDKRAASSCCCARDTRAFARCAGRPIRRVHQTRLHVAHEQDKRLKAKFSFDNSFNHATLMIYHLGAKT